MTERQSRGPDQRRMRNERLSAGDGIQFLKIAEAEIHRSIFTGVPLAELLNRVCSALDCEIGNVVSLVSLLDDDAIDLAAVAENAKRFGLHMFCSIGVVSANGGLLGKLELYSCEPAHPTRHELEIVKRGASLAAIAIERCDDPRKDDDGMIAELPVDQSQPLHWPETVH